VVAEGLSLAKWRESGETVCAFSGADSRRFLTEFKPNLVLTGLASPINLGESFGLAANELGVKLGFVADIWGAEARSRAVPDFVCTLDQFGLDKILQYPKYQGRVPRVYITGSPAMDRLLDVKNPGAIWDGVRDSRLVVLFVGQDESTTPALEGLVQALNVGGEYVLIPFFHPKRPDLLGEWNGILARATFPVLRTPQVSLHQAMKIAWVTMSVYSTALIEAAALGSLPVSWVSPIGRQKMREALGGLERFPLVDSGCTIEVETPEEFRQAVLDLGQTAYWAKIRHCQYQFGCDGKNTERVVAVIERELG
jgi:hypothetical protein